jgi:hypothetical protein
LDVKEITEEIAEREIRGSEPMLFFCLRVLRDLGGEKKWLPQG